MGMSIDTVKQWLGIQRENLKDFPEVGRDKKIESIDTAISYLEDYQELMIKHQKIEEILRDNHQGIIDKYKNIEDVVGIKDFEND